MGCQNVAYATWEWLLVKLVFVDAAIHTYVSPPSTMLFSLAAPSWEQPEQVAVNIHFILSIVLAVDAVIVAISYLNMFSKAWPKAYKKFYEDFPMELQSLQRCKGDDFPTDLLSPETKEGLAKLEDLRAGYESAKGCCGWLVPFRMAMDELKEENGVTTSTIMMSAYDFTTAGVNLALAWYGPKFPSTVIRFVRMLRKLMKSAKKAAQKGKKAFHKVEKKVRKTEKTAEEMAKVFDTKDSGACCQLTSWDWVMFLAIIADVVTGVKADALGDDVDARRLASSLTVPSMFNWSNWEDISTNTTCIVSLIMLADFWVVVLSTREDYSKEPEDADGKEPPRTKIVNPSPCYTCCCWCCDLGFVEYFVDSDNFVMSLYDVFTSVVSLAGCFGLEIPTSAVRMAKSEIHMARANVEWAIEQLRDDAGNGAADASDQPRGDGYQDVAQDSDLEPLRSSRSDDMLLSRSNRV